ncbi:MAG: hypothetical protein GX616_15160, partial [Planctomycetes bacterium]|nr:hypothetical protein [Planctomycetota bacterium]
ICEIDINDSTTGTLLNKTIVSRKDFSAASTYQSFDLPFTNTAGHSMEFRVFYIGQARLDLDKVQALNGAYAPTPKGRIVQRANTYDGALFYLYVPSTATTSNPLPLVITCHSTVTNAAAEIGLTCDATWGCCEGGSSDTKWHQLAENIGNVNGHNQPFIVAAPVCASANGGLETPWTGEAQAATDRQRILAIYNQIVGTESSTYGFAVDTDSTLLTGWSGGGIPTYYVGVREADVFSMIISRQGNFNEDMFDTASWPLDTSLGVGILAGSSDTVVPMSTHEAASAFFESEGYTALFPANPANRKHVRILPDSEFPSVPSNHYCHSLVAFDTFMDYLAGPVNQAPVADAGDDQTVVWPDDDAALDGTVTDDGLPSPPGAVTVTWTKQSGPGTVSFANPNAVDTTATFSTQGTYVLRLTASDSVLSDYDEVTITVSDCTPALEATFQGSSGFGHLCGSAISGDDWRVTVANNNCFMAYGPYTSSLPPGDMVARWYLRVDNNTADNADICQIDVYDATGSQFLAGPMTISRMDWTQAGVYQAFDLPFTNPGGGHQLEFRTYYIWYSQLDLDKVEAWSTCGGGGEPEIISLSSFASSADGWTAEGWKAGQYSNGTMAFNSSVGNPAGSMKSTGSGSTNTTDSCTREGGLIKKVISTTGYESITLDYDLRFNTNQSGSSCSGGCMSTVVEGDCADKVAVYYSTSGTGGPWTLLEQVYASQLTQGTFYSRHIDLPAGAANQAGFALMFKFQFNTSSDVGYVDNVEVGGMQQ